MTDDARQASLDATLYVLRWCAVAAQFGAFAVAHWMLRLDLHWPALLLGACTLGLVNALFGLWRERVADPRLRVKAGLAVDLAALTWALYFAGGITNPFTQLYLVPVALTAAALAPRQVIAVAIAATAAYVFIARFAPPLPHQHAVVVLNLHVAGMAANFAIGLVLFCVFGLALAARLRRQEQDLRDARERRLRDEGLHALALQSASAAHDLNTPLNTAGLLVDEWRSTPQQAPDPAELDLLAAQLAFAKDAVRRLAATTRETPPPQPLRAMLDALRDRLLLLRPQAALDIDMDPAIASRVVQPSLALWGSLGHLLENAADAGIAAGDPRLALRADDDGRALRLALRDRGAGFDHRQAGFATSSKAHGLGIGLAIANATIDHLGGELRVQRAEAGGSISTLRLPWSALSPSPSPGPA